MQSSSARWLTLFAAAVILFCVTAAIGFALIPAPRTEADYLVIGTTATLVGLLAVFAMLIATIYKSGDNFVRRRPKPNEPAPPDSDETPQT